MRGSWRGAHHYLTCSMLITLRLMMRSSGIDSLAADNIIESAAKMSTKVYSSIRVLISIDFTALSIMKSGLEKKRLVELDATLYIVLALLLVPYRLRPRSCQSFPKSPRFVP